MNGTRTSATLAMVPMPPKMMTAVSAATTTPVATGGTPKAPCTAPAIELACTALKMSPKDRIRQAENSAAAHGAFSPLAM